MGWPAWIAAGATLLAVVVLAAATPVPCEDGASYLWMAQRFAAGEWQPALAMVFPPGYPLLLAPLVALGLAPERAATLLGAASMALAVLPVVQLARRLDERAVLPAAVLWASSPLLLRLAAECYSEPPFLVLMALGTLAGLRSRFVAMGVCSALAFWVRPEGLLLAASFVLVQPRAAWRALLPVAAGIAALAAMRGAAGLGADPLPLLAFHEQRDDLPERGAWLANVVALPGPWFEAFGLAGAAALFAPWRRRDVLPAVLRWQVATQVAAICTFVVRRRFFVSAHVAVTVLAAWALARVPRRWCLALLVATAVLGGVFAWRGRIDADRAVERELGVWLADAGHGAVGLASELPRVAWFAGARPGLPRHFTAAQWLQQVAAQAPRAVVFAAEPAARGEQIAQGLAAGFAPAVLPPALAASVRARGIAVFVAR